MAFLPSLDQILNVMNAKGYRLYKGKDPERRGLNIVGIRSRADSPNKFDDTIAVFYLIPGSADMMQFAITTDPSPHYLRKPINPAGTAILREGQYVDTYKIATHAPPSGNHHRALCQRLRPVTVFRDNNRDSALDYINPESGMFGINIHRGPKNGDWEAANIKYSAGCQVFSDQDDFELFMLRCRREHQQTEKNVFTYTLLNEKDFG